MGATTSKKKDQNTAQYGNIYYQLDKSNSYSGETITGKIYINLIAPFPGNQLFLKLKGKETTHIVERENRNNQQVEILYSDHKNILKQNLFVYFWEDLLPGQYVIPFSFLLPVGLPPSFYQLGHRYLAAVHYSLEAFLLPKNDKDQRFGYKQDFVIRENVENVERDFSTEVVTNLKMCCCVPRGSNLLKVNFEKNVYAPGEMAQVFMQLDNSQSKLKNKNIKFEIKQTLEIKAMKKTKRLNLVKSKEKIAGIQTNDFLNEKTLELTFPKVQEYSNKSEIDLKKPRKELLIAAGKDGDAGLTSSTHSKLINSKYFLQVTCEMAGCCTKDPKIEYKVRLDFPEQQMQSVTPPANWEPQVMSAVNVPFPTSQYQAVNIPDEEEQEDENESMIGNKMAEHKSSVSTTIEMPSFK